MKTLRLSRLPDFATFAVIRNGEIASVPPEELRVGDLGLVNEPNRPPEDLQAAMSRGAIVSIRPIAKIEP